MKMGEYRNKLKTEIEALRNVTAFKAWESRTEIGALIRVVS
jgi:hypothetical protein